MDVRQRTEEIERLTFAPWATFSDASRGRARPEPQDPIRPVFQRDRDRVLHCKAFRRLKQKTQVFLSPEGDLYRTRLTHTLEVSQIARTIARALRLNEDLTEAIALGHDLGHTPFGHAGERLLNSIVPGGFAHFRQSLRVVERLEKEGAGLNLTWEVRNGIERHTGGEDAATLEGQVVRLADKIAYINHDIDDAIRAKMFEEKDLPVCYTDVLGHSVRERLNIMIHDIILNSLDKPGIFMSEGMEEAMMGLRQWMFDHVYKNEIPKAEEGRAQQMLSQLYFYYMDHVDELPQEYLNFLDAGEKVSRVVCDYIAGMSDIYAIDQFEKLFVPKRWNVY